MSNEEAIHIQRWAAANATRPAATPAFRRPRKMNWTQQLSYAALLLFTSVRLLSLPPDLLEQLTFSVEDGEQQKVDRRIAPALSQLRHQWNALRVPCHDVRRESHPQGPWGGYHHELKPVYHCGAIEGHFAAYAWEDRIKSRLFENIRHHNLTHRTFVGLDVGGARGDWVVAAGAEANRSRYVTVEANPILFQLLLQDLAANSGLADRVLAYNAAVKSDSLFYGHYKNHSALWNSAAQVMSNTNWTGPTMCIPTHEKHGDMSLGNKTSNSDGSCSKLFEVAVPVVTVDVVMRDFWESSTSTEHKAKSNNGRSKFFRGHTTPLPTAARGDLLFAKFDIEGSEYEALLGAKALFESNATRPCYVYIEIKSTSVNPRYEAAFNLLRYSYGYSNYHDIDSGLSGNLSYPPKGAVHSNEGNYEFQLPLGEMEGCTNRVREQS